MRTLKGQRSRPRVIGWVTCLWVMGLLLMPAAAWGQAAGEVVLTGTVTDAETGEPLEGVNVFVDGSLLGTATDEQGRYEIAEVPLGTYLLVASRVGYGQKRERLRLEEGDNTRRTDFEMAPRAVALPDVAVTAKRPAGWANHLRRFEREFLGRSSNASETDLVNPAVLDFTAEDEKLRARADAPLEVVNRALGYRLFYNLRDFLLAEGQVRYQGTVRFEKLEPEDERQAERWRENRKEAYEGSLRHFLAALAKERTKQAGFATSTTDQFARRPREVEAGQIAEPGDLPFERLLQFPDLLRVTYTDAVEDPAYVRNRQRASYGSASLARKRTEYPTSWLRLRYRPVVFHEAGYLFNPYAVTTYGYWGWERVGELLPWDYQPPAIP